MKQSKNGLTVERVDNLIRYTYEWRSNPFKRLFGIGRRDYKVAITHKTFLTTMQMIEEIQQEAFAHYGVTPHMEYLKHAWSFYVASDIYLEVFSEVMDDQLSKIHTIKYFSVLAEDLPGVMESVRMPCHCREFKVALFTAIIHLNDKHRWSRDRVADWIETLDIDTTFKEKV